MTGYLKSILGFILNIDYTPFANTRYQPTKSVTKKLIMIGVKGGSKDCGMTVRAFFSPAVGGIIYIFGGGRRDDKMGVLPEFWGNYSGVTESGAKSGRYDGIRCYKKNGGIRIGG